MPRFSDASEAALRTAHPKLQAIFREAVLYCDCSVLEGHRGREEQDRAYATGRSKLPWPRGPHNSWPSRAVDVAPYPIDWGESGSAEHRRKALARFYYFAGVVMSVAARRGVALRWGGDWDGDGDFTDQSFDDLVHFELLEA